MSVKKTWRVVGGTVAATLALGGTAALAQPGNEAPQIDLDDVVTIDEVTPATVASLFDDSPTITLDESVASATESVSLDSVSVESVSAETVSVETVSAESVSAESVSVESVSVESVSVESVSVESVSVESVSVESVSADSADSA